MMIHLIIARIINFKNTTEHTGNIAGCCRFLDADSYAITGYIAICYITQHAFCSCHRLCPSALFCAFSDVKISVCVVSFPATKLSMPLKVAYNEQEMKQMHRRKYVTN